MLHNGLFFLLSAHDGLAVPAMVWLGMVQFDALYMNLRKPHIFKLQVLGKPLVF